LMEWNPGYDGEGDWKVEDRGVTAFAVTSQHLADLAPLRALPALTDLRINGEYKAKVDIAGLAGLKLTRLELGAAGVTDLSPLKGMPLWFLNCPDNPIADLSPLRGMRLGHLSCDGSRVADLSPLRGMSLEYFGISGTNVSDLKPVEGMPLYAIRCDRTPVTDLTPLAGMKLKILSFTPANIIRGIEVVRRMDSLETIGVQWGKEYPPKEFWERYDRGEFGKPKAAVDNADLQKWMKEVAALPAARQAEVVKKKLMERNPGYAGEGDWKVEDRGVTALDVTSQHLADLVPLRALPALTDLRINGDGKAKVDLSGLAGLKLTVLHLYGAGVTDLSPLKGMPLTQLDCPSNGITDLSPLRGMPLWLLNCPGNPIDDLSPLQGMQLGHLACDGSRISDLSPLKGMPIGYLAFTGTKVSDLRPLEGMPLSSVMASDTPVTDLTPLAGMKLKVLTFPQRTVTRGIEAVRSIDSFERIGVQWNKIYPPREFWERYDKAEFGKAPTEPGRPK
jgi:Leucine-rich repeat (LRR) protein